MTTSELIFLESIFIPKLWGGSRLQEYYDHELPDTKIGESLVISGHPDADCTVRSGRFEGQTLSALWSEHRYLFGDVPGDSFPLQLKLIDAHADLSVQVHPDEECARRYESDEPKNECWYVLAPSRTGTIAIGHVAQSPAELTALVDEGRWDELLRYAEMNEGDFYFIPAGTAHCLLAGSLIYEVMQSSSTTYRLYDFDRLEDDGTKRELHLDKALTALNVPDASRPTEPVTVASEGATETSFIRNEYFSVRKWEVHSTASFAVDEPFLLVSALEGAGTINGTPVARGDHFVVPHDIRDLKVEGPLTLMVTSL
jgi:mannose-6-phosphate isomerase